MNLRVARETFLNKKVRVKTKNIDIVGTLTFLGPNFIQGSSLQCVVDRVSIELDSFKQITLEPG